MDCKRCFDITFSGAGAAAIVGAKEGSDTCRFRSVSTCRRERLPRGESRYSLARGRRRSWSPGEKAAIVAESFEEGVRACHVARRHGLTPQQLFAWRREARDKSRKETDAPPFVPALVEAPNEGVRPLNQVESEAAGTRPHSIELDIEGSSV
jgi:transposase-like protein